MVTNGRLNEAGPAYQALVLDDDQVACEHARLVAEAVGIEADTAATGLEALEAIQAARAIGMSRRKAMRLIIIPQALKIVLPAFGNEFVSLIKETSVLSYVGVVEILRRGALWNAATFNTFEAYVGVAVVYLLLTVPTSNLIRALERKMATDRPVKTEGAP